MSDSAQTVVERINALAQISEELGGVTRTYGSPAMRRVNELAGAWMREAGMTVSEDAFGNIVGHYAGRAAAIKTFLLGSHLDTVRHAGKFDGPLGLLLAIESVRKLHESQTRMDFGVEIIGFADGEGLRFQTAQLASRIVAGTFDEQELKRTDAAGISLAEAIRNFGGDPAQIGAARRDPQTLLGYAEVQLEHGPVLEKKFQPLGVVSAIAGRTRLRVRFTGQTANAGSTPMNLRHDALAAAAQFVTAVETCTRIVPGLMATATNLEIKSGAGQIIPGEAVVSVDACHPLDSTRASACNRLQESAALAGEKRGVNVEWEVTAEVEAVPCSRELSAVFGKAARRQLLEAAEMTCGADHAVAVMGGITPVSMLLVRCKDGLDADEAVSTGDIQTAVTVLHDFLLMLGNQINPLLGRKRG